MTGRRVVVRAPEVLDPRPVEPAEATKWFIRSQLELARALDRIAEREVVEPEPAVSKTIPWVLIAISAAILLYTLWAMWHSLHGPEFVRVRSHPVDLVGPHR